MWDQGGQPWPQWPLSQQQWMQSFQHQQDPSQVDWAALAQAWIAQKESTVPEQPRIQPNGQDIPGLEPVGQSNHGAFQGDPAFGRMWQPEWGMHGQPPPLPPPPPPDQAWIPPGSGPMDVVNPSEDSNSQDSVEFNSEAHRGVYPQNSHGYGAQPDSYAMAPMAMNQFDYQHGAASSFPPTPTGFHSPYWQGPPQNRRDARPPGFRERPRSPIQIPVKQEAAAPLDAVKRRTLPVWIREGLEKMDREKQKKLERERMEKERAEMAKDDGNQHEADKDGDGPRVPRKSKFDSDDEGNDDNNDEAKPVIKREFSVRSPSPPAEDSEPEMTEEEKEFQLMIITKTLLTEILLEVTNEEIVHIAKDTHRKATRAPAKQLAQSSALASLTGLSGLGDYGSDESDDDDERSVRGSESSDTDEEELHHRIREKQDAFRRKERDMQQLLEKQSQEALLAREEMVKERLIREKGEHDEGQAEIPHKQEVKERQAEPMVERRRSRSEKEGSESKHFVRGKERSGRGGSHSPANGHRSSSLSTSSHSSSRSSSSSSSSSSASSRSSSRSSSPQRKRRRSRSSSHKARKRSHSSQRRRSDRREKVRDRRRSSADRSGRHKTERSDSRERRSHRSRSRSRDRDRGKARARDSRSRSREREKEKDRDKKRSRDCRDSSLSKHKQKGSSKDRERRRDKSHSHEKDKKKKDKDKEREKDSDKKKEKPKGNEKEKGSSGVTEENGKSKKRRESDSFTDSQSDRHSRQESKGSKKGSAKASKKRSDSDSSRSPSPEVSKEKKSKKSKRSRSRSTEKSHKSGKKASRKHKSKSRSR
ncbi:arginine/serine-rich protein PNISR isoform X5 [Platichthys flesus]|nr:arginine/serine-rich protein PNISR isoform X5 [Platichthys flesus]